MKIEIFISELWNSAERIKLEDSAKKMTEVEAKMTMGITWESQ